MPCVFSAANEVAVNSFLAGNISFLDIVTVIEHTMENHTLIAMPTLSDLFKADEQARSFASKIIREIKI